MRRKNNIFFSAFVLIATFAFMLSPLSVVAASLFRANATTTASACTEAGGTVKTNFYLFSDAEVRASDATNVTGGVYEQFLDAKDHDGNDETFTYPTSKTFKVGLGNSSNKLIADGEVAVGNEGDNKNLEHWSLETYYTELKASLASTDNVKTSGDYAYAAATAWTSKSGVTVISNTALPENNSDAIAATVRSGVTVNFDPAASTLIDTDTTIKIDRVYTKGAFSSVTTPYTATYNVDGFGWVWHPAIYYVQYCAYPDGAGGGDTTPTSTEFKVEYDANGGASAPATQESKDGKPITISSDKPNRTGFTFLGWSDKKDATEPDSKYAAGQLHRGPNDLKLYAVWSPKTGVSDYLMATAIIAGVAGLGLFVSRRKKLFKQI